MPPFTRITMPQACDLLLNWAIPFEQVASLSEGEGSDLIVSMYAKARENKDVAAFHTGLYPIPFVAMQKLSRDDINTYNAKSPEGETPFEQGLIAYCQALVRREGDAARRAASCTPPSPACNSSQPPK